MLPWSPAAITERLDRASIPEPNSGCVLWAEACNDRGYGVINIERRQYKAHRLAWEATNGPIPDDLFVCHKCDVRACINPAHLFLGTQQKNLADMTAKGRRSRGTPQGKLTPEQVLAIRSASGSQYKIAEQFGIHQATVSWIKSGDGWKHLGEAGLCR